MSKGHAISYSEAELAFIKQHSTLPRPELTEQFNTVFGRSLKVENLSALCKRNRWHTGRDGHFTAGQPSWNKGKKGLKGACSTSFKKGHVPHNHKPVGHERITVDGFIEVKVAEPNVFKGKYRIIYEQHHGEIPKGSVIKFIDGNPLNCDISNLMMISRSALVRLNQSYDFNAVPNELKPTLIAMSQLKARIGEVKRAGN